MNTHNLLVLFSLLAVSTAVGGQGLGGYKPIKDLTDPDVVDIAKFAVKEHNTQSGDHLQYDHIVKGEQQVVAGMNYHLVIAAKDGKNYEAVVWERVWEHFRKLIFFKAYVNCTLFECQRT